MLTWTLILFAHVGIMGKTDSNALTSVPGFESYASCQKAGEAAKSMATGTVKEIRYVCVTK